MEKTIEKACSCSVEQSSLRDCVVSLFDGEFEINLSLQLPETAVEPIFSGGGWIGSRVWHASLRLCDVLGLRRNELKGKKVLELGSGVGVPGLCAAFLGATVCLTEQHPLDQLLSKNISAIRQQNPHLLLSSTKLDWKEVLNDSASDIAMKEIYEQLNGWSELILISDCIFQDVYGDSWKLLASVLRIFQLKNNDVVILNSVERRNQKHSGDGVEDFKILLKQFGFETNLLKTFDGDNTNGCIEIYSHSFNST